MTKITGYHAHVYFDEQTVSKARALCERARDELRVEMGRVHERCVGPHPKWSCQLAFSADRVGEVLPWLMEHRGELTVFLHGESGDDWADHTQHVVWLGESVPLNLAFFERRAS